MKTSRCLLTAAMIIWSCAATTPADATTRTVTSLNDSGPGTLRDTIGASASGDTIVFTTNGIITLTGGELLVGRSLNITGPGATNLTLNGANSSRLFEISGGASVTISGLTISAGFARGLDGGLTFVPNGLPGQGGGILNNGTLVLANCYFLNNKAQGGNGFSTYGTDDGAAFDGGEGDGGAIFNNATLSVTACTFFLNKALGGLGGDGSGSALSGNGGGAFGGAVLNATGNTGSMGLTNCTFYLNQCLAGDAGGENGVGGNGGDAGGSAISTGGASNFLVNCTIAQNSSIAGNASSSASANHPGYGGNAYGGGINAFIYSATTKNTIIAGNSTSAGTGRTIGNNGNASAPDFSGIAGSLGYNLIGETDGSIGWQITDLIGTKAAPLNPQLASLHFNGGPTMTMALNANSPAIDAGDDAVLSAPYNLTTDQRGVYRPNGFHVDIGAFEFGGTELVTTFADSGLGSLRQAIASAAAGDRVIFTPLITGTIFLTNGELLINNQVSIIGPGATNLAISGKLSSRVFHVSSTGDLNMIGLTLADGLEAGATGTGGSMGTAGGNGSGGGLFDEGSAALTDCVVTNCSATGGRGGSSSASAGVAGGNALGGGIFNSSVLTMLRCTLSGNSALGGQGGTGGQVSNNGVTGGTGGAAFGAGLASTGMANLTDCTIALNSAAAGVGGTGGGSGAGGTGGVGGSGGSAHGAALSPDSGSLTLTSCTISSNLTLGGNGGQGGKAISSGQRNSSGSGGGATGGGVFSASNVQLQDCLVAVNQAGTSPDVAGTVNSGGFNLVGITDGSAGWLAAEESTLGNSSFPINPKLGPLQNNGGATPTMALLNSSPALDKGNSFSLGTDQRGYARIFDISSVTNATGGDGSDVGAFEASVAPTLTLFGRGSNPFNLQLTGSPGWSYAIQATTNGGGPGWTTVVTNTSPFIFADTNAVNFQHRFYRAVSLP